MGSPDDFTKATVTATTIRLGAAESARSNCTRGEGEAGSATDVTGRDVEICESPDILPCRTAPSVCDPVSHSTVRSASGPVPYCTKRVTFSAQRARCCHFRSA